jgi:catechol-2,3-dioxygenase
MKPGPYPLLDEPRGSRQDLDRGIAFYRDVLGFDVMRRYGDEAAFLSAGGYRRHIALNTWESKGGSPPAPRPQSCLLW